MAGTRFADADIYIPNDILATSGFVPEYKEYFVEFEGVSIQIIGTLQANNIWKINPEPNTKYMLNVSRSNKNTIEWTIYLYITDWCEHASLGTRYISLTHAMLE